MSNLLMLDSSDDVKVVGKLGSYLAKTMRAELKIARGFVIPIDKHVGYGLSNEILREYDRLQLDKCVVRTSPIPDNLAGEVRVPVARDELIDTVISLQADAAKHWQPCAIIVQEYLDGELMGTIYSQNPYTGAHDEVLIETSLWASNSVLGDDDEPEMILLDKRDGTVSLESDEEQTYLEAEQVQTLYRAIRKAEKAISEPISLDWGFVNGVLYILRTRPLGA
jgi:phosphoenolpyruvate synthase/pyruvate phosphate dikinase